MRPGFVSSAYFWITLVVLVAIIAVGFGRIPLELIGLAILAQLSMLLIRLWLRG